MVLLSGSDGRQIAKSRLLSDAVAEDFDVFGDFLFGLLTGDETLMTDQFASQGAPRTFHRCIVPTVSFFDSLTGLLSAGNGVQVLYRLGGWRERNPHRLHEELSLGNGPRGLVMADRVTLVVGDQTKVFNFIQ